MSCWPFISLLLHTVSLFESPYFLNTLSHSTILILFLDMNQTLVILQSSRTSFIFSPSPRQINMLDLGVTALKLDLKHFWWTFLLLKAIFWFVSISIHVPKIILKGFTQKRFDHILFGYAESRPNINNVEICLRKNFYICETKNSTNHCESLIDK